MGIVPGGGSVLLHLTDPAFVEVAVKDRHGGGGAACASGLLLSRSRGLVFRAIVSSVLRAYTLWCVWPMQMGKHLSEGTIARASGAASSEDEPSSMSHVLRAKRPSCRLNLAACLCAIGRPEAFDSITCSNTSVKPQAAVESGLRRPF